MPEKSNSSPHIILENADPRWERVIAWAKSLFFDRLGSASRPKLLLAVTIADLVSIVVAWPLANALLGNPFEPSWRSFALTTLVAVLAVYVLRRQWSYSIPALRGFTSQALKVLTSLGAVALGISGFAFLFDHDEVAPREIAAWMELSAVFLCVVRSLAAWTIDRLTRAGSLVRRTVIVGGGQEAEDLIRELSSDPTNHMRILGVFDDRQDARAAGSYGGIARLGTFETLTDFCRDAGVDLLIVTVPTRAEERLMEILYKLFTLQVDVRISALNSKLRLNSRAYSFIGRVPMLAVMDKPLSDWDRVLKNVEDRVLAALLLLLVSPIMALVALAVRLDSKGPIFFRQKRYGFNSEVIEVLKFRSMYVEMQDDTASKQVTRGDPRVTPVGRFIRRTSLDELPQLINVLKGEMSLVGPRPHATGAKAERDLYENVVQGYFARHRMKPGVTGWAQINGWRGETDTHEKLVRRVEHDLYYIDNWSVLFDLYIIALTPLSLLTGKNAY
ncbi:undecaprenyl-phosphate glucose phosphotransferase [Hyphomicrobium facile]|uniref:Undecaprenyl-phosphate glucose phosphotransferase n=1 Tax=Hyphomicrobium facile TaxID=51670 RepID=A0A1I7NVC6_9HYPH|nr:undecaprenyl-phosphate glucose phosphotransferase [Hyphomicrobium facile]SFV38621.1 Undecaprenyl-phosphate glucose phosphotransferase [Hyphomicrobium facile]